MGPVEAAQVEAGHHLAVVGAGQHPRPLPLDDNRADGAGDGPGRADVLANGRPGTHQVVYSAGGGKGQFVLVAGVGVRHVDDGAGERVDALGDADVQVVPAPAGRAMLDHDRRARRGVDAGGKAAVGLRDGMGLVVAVQIDQQDMGQGQGRAGRAGDSGLAQIVGGADGDFGGVGRVVGDGMDVDGAEGQVGAQVGGAQVEGLGRSVVSGRWGLGGHIIDVRREHGLVA